MWYNAVNMMEGAELTQQMHKTGSQEQGNIAGRAADYLIEPIKEGSKEFLKSLILPEIKPVLSTEGQKKPEIKPFPVNQERATTPTNTDSKPSPMAAPVSQRERMDRMQSQARINEIRKELKQAR
jgi:hypothetical protein